MSESDKTIQSLRNLKQAMRGLGQAVKKKSLSDLELAGAIQNFEFCYELSWKTIQKYAGARGARIATPRDAFQFALEAGMVSDEKTWLKMLEDRNETVHTYDHSTARRVFEVVKENYHPAFLEFVRNLEKLIPAASK